LKINDPGLNEFWEISNNALFGEPNPSKDYLKELSPVNYVSKNTPPTFMWHTANDGLVPVGNSINFASELSKKGVPYELHIFEDGVHGLSLCNKLTANEAAHINKNAEVWFGMVLTWLKKYTEV
jgi:dipeptidyl aminopeptidase/acylaminoacyl peptidase